MKNLAKKLQADWQYLSKPHMQLRAAIQTVLAVVVATGFAWLFKLSMPFWASITAAILVSSHVGATIDKSLMRIAGTVCGAVFGVIIVVLFAHHISWLIISLALVILICCYCSAVGRYQYAFILLPVTAVMIALMATPVPTSVYSLASARMVEILLGVGAAWLVSLSIFPAFARDKLTKELTNLLTEIKQSFIEVTEHYLLKINNKQTIIKLHQQINQKLNAYKKLLIFAQKEITGDKFNSMQVLNNIKHMRLLLIQQNQFNNSLNQTTEIAMPEAILPLLQQAIKNLINMFDYIANPTDLSVFDEYCTNFHTILSQVYVLREEYRIAGHAYQYSIESNIIFYAFIELLEKTQYYLAHIVNNKQESFKLTKYLSASLKRFARYFWLNFKALRNNTTEIIHSVKVTLSATLTLLIWLYMKSPAIVIAVVSVLAVAQLNMYGSKKKAESRILGCLLGGLTGIILIVLPLSLLQFYFLVAVAVAVFAYLSADKGNLIDIGVQANFALFTAVITEWGMQLTVDPALGRLAGVLLGSVIAVVTGYFIWPLDPVVSLRKHLASNCNNFARWLMILNTSQALPTKPIDTVLLKQVLLAHLANTESLFVYLAEDKTKAKYQNVFNLQYQLFFNLVVFEQNKNNLQAAAVALNVDIHHYFQRAINKLHEFELALLGKQSPGEQINIQEVLLAAKQQLVAIRNTAKLMPYKVQQVKVFLVVLNDLIQLLVYLQRTESELSGDNGQRYLDYTG